VCVCVCVCVYCITLCIENVLLSLYVVFMCCYLDKALLWKYTLKKCCENAIWLFQAENANNAGRLFHCTLWYNLC